MPTHHDDGAAPANPSLPRPGNLSMSRNMASRFLPKTHDNRNVMRGFQSYWRGSKNRKDAGCSVELIDSVQPIRPTDRTHMWRLPKRAHANKHDSCLHTHRAPRLHHCTRPHGHTDVHGNASTDSSRCRPRCGRSSFASSLARIRSKPLAQQLWSQRF